MGHSYYSYTKEELVGNGPKLPVIVMEDNAEVFHSMAVEMVDEIKKHNEKGEKTVFICPVGPVGQYPYFVDMVNEQNISLKNVWFINMDEYLDDEKQWISKDHPLSFRGFMQRTVYDKVRPELVMPEDQRVFPDPNHPEYITEQIEKLGGVDISFGGIGINGHVAFNEADPSLTNEEFLAQKINSICSMIGVCGLSMFMDRPILKNIFQFKGIFPTMDQARIISTATFAC